MSKVYDAANKLADEIRNSEEFLKANIIPKTVRIEENGRMRWEIKYNAGKYTSNQSDTIARIFYNTQMTYAPGLMIDRTNLLSVGVTTSGEPGGPIFSVNEVASRGLLDEYFRLMQSDMSPIALDVQHSFDAATRNLSVTVRGDILVELANRNTLALGIAILEDNLEGTQAGVAGKYMHSHVCRDAMTSILGTLVKGDSNTFECTYSNQFSKTLVQHEIFFAMKPLLYC